jgi:hypothetical protein
MADEDRSERAGRVDRAHRQALLDSKGGALDGPVPITQGRGVGIGPSSGARLLTG